MSHAIQKITWLLCVTALTIAFKEPAYLFLLFFLPLVGRKKEINKTAQEVYFELNEKLDLLTSQRIQDVVNNNRKPKEEIKENDK